MKEHSNESPGQSWAPATAGSGGVTAYPGSVGAPMQFTGRVSTAQHSGGQPVTQFFWGSFRKYLPAILLINEGVLAILAFNHLFNKPEKDKDHSQLPILGIGLVKIFRGLLAIANLSGMGNLPEHKETVKNVLDGTRLIEAILAPIPLAINHGDTWGKLLDEKKNLIFGVVAMGLKLIRSLLHFREDSMLSKVLNQLIGLLEGIFTFASGVSESGGNTIKSFIGISKGVRSGTGIGNIVSPPNAAAVPARGVRAVAPGEPIHGEPA